MMWEGPRKHREPAIWVYGGLEFHFDHTAGGELFLIYRDTADGIVETSIGRRRANAPGKIRGPAGYAGGAGQIKLDGRSG